MNLWKLVLAITLTGLLSSSANAQILNFDFSMPNNGNPNDLVTGELLGLTNGTNIDPTKIEIFSAPSYMGFGSISQSNPYIFQPDFYYQSASNGPGTSATTPGTVGFDVVNDSIALTSEIKFSDVNNNSLLFNSFSNEFEGSTDAGDGAFGLIYGEYDDYSILPSTSGATYTLVIAAPEPSTWAMLLIGFGLLVFGLRRRRT